MVRGFILLTVVGGGVMPSMKERGGYCGTHSVFVAFERRTGVVGSSFYDSGMGVVACCIEAAFTGEVMLLLLDWGVVILRGGMVGE